MSVRRTLGDVKSPIAKVLGMCATDSRVIDYINEATELLMNRGRWVGTYQRYRICADKAGCITWPRQVETIEAWGVCNQPGIIRNQWYEFLDNGPGLVDKCDNIGNTMIDRGTACTFDDISGITKLLRVYADVAEDAGAVLTVQGYDENNNWIRTQVSGSWIDGEQIAISTTPTNSTKIFTAITAVIKPVTNGIVRLYSYEPTLTTQASLGIYEPDETRPLYRRSQIPSLEGMAGGTGGSCGCGSSSSSSSSSVCETKRLTVMVRLRYLPVRLDNDWLFISNLPALKKGVQSIMKRDRNIPQEADMYEASAVRELDKELQTYEGDGTVGVPRFQNRMEWGGGGVSNII